MELSQEQRAVLAASGEPLRISAGAGTGKTSTLAMLVADAVAHRGIEPEAVLGVTFTNKAAGEMADRIRGHLAPIIGPGREAEVHTYHGFAGQVVEEFGALVGIERRSSVITPTFTRQLLHESVSRLRFDRLDVTWTGVVDRIHRLGAAVGDHLVDLEALSAQDDGSDLWAERSELLAVWNAYRRRKSELGVVDYADLISSAARLLEDHPDVADRIRLRYRLVLLDEYQDTNPAQRIMLQRLFPSGVPVVAVGDNDQSIYEWRGASPDNLTRFPSQFRRSDGQPAVSLPLTVNRRSDHRILDVANAVRECIGEATSPLQAGPSAGIGSVATRWARDAVTEAGWIADRAQQLHEEGTPWSEMAILFRKNRHIALVHDALAERDIPVEVVNLGGLLSVPEVADLRAWMRIIDSPGDGPALLRILMGRRFALGMGDLRRLSAWVERQDKLGADDDYEGVPRHSMVEAVDHLEDLELPDRARGALERFAHEYRTLLEAAQGSSLAELTRTILDVTGAWRDLEAKSPSGRLTARLNLYRFLDFTEEWSPLEGRPSLPAFLAHLGLMEDNPAEELDAARLSGEEAVALVTVHRAKGLEWDVVFLPALARGTFPSGVSAFEDPYRRAHFLPHEWRLDDPPDFGADTPEKEAKDILRARHLRQEWRIAYVAVTRARHRLFLTGAHWYGAQVPNTKPVDPSELFELVSGLEGVEDLGTDPLGERPQLLRAHDRVSAPDPLFPAGWESALRAAIADPSTLPRLSEDHGLGAAVALRAGEYQQRLFDVTPDPHAAPGIDATSATGLVTYASCPRRFFWSEVDRLPRRPSPGARRGVEVHRRIELHALGHVPFTDLDTDPYDVTREGESESAGSDHPHPYDAYLSSEYANRRPLATEVPFQFPTASGLTVRGRIDAIYPDGDGWEIVDFKSGRRRQRPWLGIQLQSYAVAATRVDFGLPPADRLAVSFVYLGEGPDIARTEVDDDWLDDAAATVEDLADGIRAERFEPTPCEACHICEFSRFCPAGREWLDEHEMPAT